MFKFSNIKKLFSYNFSRDLKNTVPKGNKSVMQDSAYKDIRNGAITRIIAVIVSELSAIGIAVYTIIKALNYYYGSEIFSYAIKQAFLGNIGKYILDILLASIVPIAVLIYIGVMRKKAQNSWPIFILLIVTLIQTAYYLYTCISWFISFAINPLFGISGLISVLLVLLGNVHISVGCIDYCLKSSNEYLSSNPNANSGYNYQPNQVNNGMNTINNQNVGYQPNVNPQMSNINNQNVGYQPNVNPQMGNINNQGVVNQPNINPQVANNLSGNNQPVNNQNVNNPNVVINNIDNQSNNEPDIM